ncbi:unnamed protein product [Penicillium roqueforti FM164]|uniref:Genomic scaffold, ProqFM164S02 n=1 Tax=Penicillium roqueforti (strain FM164) TaxID=1365484 RepID=W6Q869_PENRF|nr:unnamed protein product [Penicillium roqueforti FM164]
MMAIDGMDVDPGSLRPNPLVTLVARMYNAAATASLADILLPFGVMTITTDEREKRSISLYMCYSYYLYNPLLVLYAEFRQNEYTTYAIVPS